MLCCSASNKGGGFARLQEALQPGPTACAPLQAANGQQDHAESDDASAPVSCDAGASDFVPLAILAGVSPLASDVTVTTRAAGSARKRKVRTAHDRPTLRPSCAPCLSQCCIPMRLTPSAFRVLAIICKNATSVYAVTRHQRAVQSEVLSVQSRQLTCMLLRC